MDMKTSLQKVYAKLSMVDQMLLNNYINKESDRIVTEIAQEVDYCISATLIEAFPMLSTKDIREILDRALKYKADQQEKVTVIRKEYGKGIKNFVDKIGDKITERTKQLVKDGVNQNNALKILKSEFKGIPSASIINYYKSAKEEYRGREVEIKATIEEDKELQQKAEYIISDEKPKSEKVDSLFKIKNKTIELEGTYDEYKVDNDKLIVRDKEYTSIADIEDIYGSEINVIAKELEIARNRLNEARKVFNEFIK